MSLITISRGSYSRGKEVAEKVAARLGYECIDRDALIEASREFNIPEIKLVRAIHDAPSILNRFTYGKEKYISYIRAALLRKLKADNMVYHGLAGHFFLRGISHVLKVRIIADIEDRARYEMEREGITMNEALKILKKDDEERRKWSKYLYGIDTADPALYDLVIHIKTISVDDAVSIICDTVQLEHFQTTDESQKAMNDLALSAELKAALIDVAPKINVTVTDGAVFIKVKASQADEIKIRSQIEKTIESFDGIKNVDIQFRLTDPID